MASKKKTKAKKRKPKIIVTPVGVRGRRSLSNSERDATPVTSQEKVFCREWIVNGGNGMLAAQAAGYAPTNAHSASTQAGRLLNRAAIQEEIKRLRSISDTTDEDIMQLMHEGLRSFKVNYIQHEGLVTGQRITPDFATRANYAKMAIKIKSAYAPVRADEKRNRTIP
jgi:phage terminase small subunit